MILLKNSETRADPGPREGVPDGTHLASDYERDADPIA